MIKHYVLEINPEAAYQWERCTLRNPITGESPDLKEELAKAVGIQPGSYLIALKLEVEILEQTASKREKIVPRTYPSLAAS